MVVGYVIPTFPFPLFVLQVDWQVVPIVDIDSWIAPNKRRLDATLAGIFT